MVEVMKIMETSFKRSGAHTATLSVPDPAAGHRGLTPLRASLGQSLVESLLLSPGSWRTQSFVCALQRSVFPVPCKFWLLYGGVNGGFLQEALCYTQVCCTQSPCLCGRPLLEERLEHSKAGLPQSLWSLLVCTKFCFDSKPDFTPPTIFLGFSFVLGHGVSFFWWDSTLSCQQLFSSEL